MSVERNCIETMTIVHGFRPESENLDPRKKVYHVIVYLMWSSRANFSSVAPSSEQL